MNTILFDNAFILGAHPFGENDRRLEVFFRTYGKVFVFAKSIRKESALLRCNALPYQYSRITVVRGYRPILKDITTKEHNREIWTNKHRRTVFRQALAFLSRFVGEEREYSEIFDTLVWFMNEIKDCDDTAVLEYFLYVYFAHSGVLLGYVEKDIVGDRSACVDYMKKNNIKRKEIYNAVFQMMKESHL